MLKFLLFAYLSFSFLFAKAQSQLASSFSVLDHSADLHFDDQLLDIKRWPLLRHDLAYNWFIHDNFYLEFGLPFQYTQLSYEIVARDLDNKPMDSEVISTYAYIGLKTGLGFAIEVGRTARIMIPVGAEVFTTKFSSSYLYIPEGERISFLQARPFIETIGYSFFVQPQYQFSFGRKKYNPWRFSVSTIGLMVSNEFNLAGDKPVFTFGAGLGLSYNWR